MLTGADGGPAVAGFTFGDQATTTRLTAGDYPNIAAMIPAHFTATGTAVVAFTVAASRRIYDQATGQWQDGDTLFLRCSAWRELADHTAESLSKGMRVIVTGRLKQRSYETSEGKSAPSSSWTPRTWAPP